MICRMVHIPLDVPRSRRGVHYLALSFLLSLCVLVPLGIAESSGSPQAATLAVLPSMLDPVLEQPAPEVTFNRYTSALWLEALKRPEFDLRVGAAEAFSKAHRQGVRGLQDAIPVIENVLRTDPHVAVRYAAARALIELGNRQSAQSLQDAIADIDTVPPGFVLEVDAALAAWDHPAARAMWTKRLSVSAHRPAVTISAIRALALVGEKSAAGPLSKSVGDRTLPMPIRLEAARALPCIDAPDRSYLAEGLSKEESPWGPLLALLVLGADAATTPPLNLESHSIALVIALTSSADARVRSSALALLRRADVSLALAKPDLLHDPDDQVRLEAVGALASAPPSTKLVAPLAAALDDLSEPVRVTARVGLKQLGTGKDTSGAVVESINAALSAERWRAAEQAAILAGDLHATVVAGQLAMLLESDRAEVRLAAVTALRLLDLTESLPALTARAVKLTRSVKEASKDSDRFESESRELCQIFIAFAQQRYRPAADLLSKYVPKRSGFHPTARGSAIYALGKIFESDPQPELAAQLLERASDNNPVDPEAADVRRFSAIALGRMEVREALPTLKELYESENSMVSVGGACRWAIMRIEKTNLPPCRPIAIKAGPFFIESIQADPTLQSP